MVVSTNLKHMLVKLEHFPKDRGEHTQNKIWNHQADFVVAKGEKTTIPLEGSWYLAPEVPHPMMTVWLSLDTQSGVLWPNATGRVGRFQHVISCWEVTLQRICPWNPQWFMGAKISLEVQCPICFEWYFLKDYCFSKGFSSSTISDETIYTLLMGRLDFPAIDTGLSRSDRERQTLPETLWKSKVQILDKFCLHCMILTCKTNMSPHKSI